MEERRTILEMLGVTLEYLAEVVAASPSLRGILAGYIAERKLWDWFASDGRVTSIRKDDDHDRDQKGDLVVAYKGFDFRIEVKSLQTNSIEIFDPDAGKWLKKVVQEASVKQAGGKRQRRKWIESEPFKILWRKGPEDAVYRGGVQCDASDRRIIAVGGQQVNTTNLLVGEFDILAAGLFAFREKWDFGFILNRNLPRSTYAKYPEEVRNQLIKTMIPVTWPLPEKFENLFPTRSFFSINWRRKGLSLRRTDRRQRNDRRNLDPPFLEDQKVRVILACVFLLFQSADAGSVHPHQHE